MEVYKFKNLENGDILLKKVTLDNTNYKMVTQNNGDKILKKIVCVNITDLKNIEKYNFKNSKILSLWVLNDDEMIIISYKSILKTIYKIINDKEKIIKKSKLNILIEKKTDQDFYYLEDLGISIQDVDSNKYLLEIINQCVENKISLIMKIKLDDETNININF